MGLNLIIISSTLYPQEILILNCLWEMWVIYISRGKNNCMRFVYDNENDKE